MHKFLKRSGKKFLIWLLILFILFMWGTKNISSNEIKMRRTRYAIVEQVGMIGHLGIDLYKTLIDLLPQNTESMREYLNTFYDSREINYYEFPETKEIKNVILLQLEGIDSITLEIEKDGKMVMPNLYHLKNNAIYFENVYDQTGSGRTSDGESATLLSLLPIEGMSLFTNYDLSSLNSLPKIMSQSGRVSMAFHGNTGSYWNRASAHKSLGYDKGFYIEELGKEIENNYSGWGLSDGAVLQAAFNEIASSTEDVFAHIILITAHHPYDAVNKMDIDLPYKEPNSDIESYINVLYYTDLVIGEFVKNLQESGILEESLLVVFSDHDSGFSRTVYKYMDKAYTGDFSSDKVPLIIYDGLNQYMDSSVMGQTDIMPLICSYLGLEIPENAMGLNYVDGNKVVYLPNAVIDINGAKINTWDMKKLTESIIVLGETVDD